jgi:RIO kinase 1
MYIYEWDMLAGYVRTRVYIYCQSIHTYIYTHIHIYEGDNNWAAPRLKDAQLSQKRFRECYLQLIKIMRVMYQKAKLVHADLSEYNILYYKKQLWIIDVSQSVEHEHPHALDFLKKVTMYM